MEAKEVLHIMLATAPAATPEDAAAFLAICRERGLTPFTEASPIVMDYSKRDGTRVHSLSVKEHYAVAERWAAQSGGYTIRLREVTKDKEGNYRARIGIVSNRDYAAVGQFCARVPGVNFREELEGFMVIGEATLTAEEQRKPAPKGKTWEWLVEKRARESAILQKFGREPSQSRQLYTAALAAVNPRETTALLYDERPALAAPAPTPMHAPIEAEIVEPEPVAEPEPEPVEEIIIGVSVPGPEPEPSASMTLADARSYYSAALNAAKKAGRSIQVVSLKDLTVAQIIAAADAL